MLLKARASTREGAVSDTLAPSVPHKATAKHHPSASHSRPPSSPLARSSSPLRGPLSALFSSPAAFPVHIPAAPLTRGPRLHPPPRWSLKSSRLAAFGYFCLAFVANYRSPNACGFYMFGGVGGTRGVTGFPFPRLRPCLSSTSRAPLFPSGPQCAPRFPRPSRSRHAAKFGPRLPHPAAHTPRPPPGWTRALTPRPGRRGCRGAHRPAPAAAAAGRGGGPAERSLPPNPQRAGAPWGPGGGPRQ